MEQAEISTLFYDIRQDLSPDIHFLVVIGGRGIGKTYSALDWLQEEPNMLYVRNQADEIKLCCTYKGNPFKTLNKDKGYSYNFETCKGMYNIYKETTVDGEIVKEDVGTGLSLATTGKTKGFDFSDSTRIVWDEFIPDPDLVLRFDEGDAFLRFYETVNRNREILGNPPVQVVMLSNATQISSRALYSLRIADEVERMVRNGIRKMTIPQRGIRIVLPDATQLRELKEETALYKAAGKESKFSRNALNNEFTTMSLQNVKKRKLIEYKAICAYENMYLYKHKHRNEIYVCSSYADVEVYTELDTKELFLRRFFSLRDAMLNGTFVYETYQIKKRFLELFKLG